MSGAGEVQLVGWMKTEVVELQVGELSSVVNIFFCCTLPSYKEFAVSLAIVSKWYHV